MSFSKITSLAKAASVLGIKPSSSANDAKSAYRLLAKQFHPDVAPLSNDKFNQITEAYEYFLQNYDKALNIDFIFDDIMTEKEKPKEPEKQRYHIWFNNSFSQTELRRLKKTYRKMGEHRKTPKVTQVNDVYLRNEQIAKEFGSNKLVEKVVMQIGKASVFVASSYGIVQITDIYIGSVLSVYLFYLMYFSHFRSKI